jgi:NB-ARC domain
MRFLPIEIMMRRVETNGAESDTVRFVELLYAGELIVKLSAAPFISGLEDDVDGHRYRLVHGLVRADGLGDWESRLEEVLTGLASQHLSAGFHEDRRIFNERVGLGSWQYDAVNALHRVLVSVHPQAPEIPGKVTLRSWFLKFAELRNKTRGHGATTPAMCAKLVADLDRAIRLVAENNPVFQRPWAYLHRNLSGKYRIMPVGGDQSVFSKLASAAALRGENYADGIYVWAGKPRRVELVRSDLNVNDFLVANGNFNGSSFEFHSLITDARARGDAAPYLAVAAERPSSETEGGNSLDVIGNVFTNLPGVPADYVRRPRLEDEVESVLKNDRHPIVTLVGRGGIGKTALTLKTLHKIAHESCFETIVWFSAHDVDLTSTGPKVVRPKALTAQEIAEQYFSLLYDRELTKDEKKSAVSNMAHHLRQNPNGPTLFVFDNFETLQSPIDLFQWIDAHIKLPNKILITTRFRDFKADFPIEVQGMEAGEAHNLIDNVLARLKAGPLKSREREAIIEETDGHPYVIKIMLGELANKGLVGKPAKILAGQDDILDALFERTYANLTPMAMRVFLMLSCWHSLVPQIAVEAVLLRHRYEGADPARACDELVRMSLVERLSAGDGKDFLSVPLTAAIFAKKKLDFSPQRDVIESDVRFLQDIGPTAKSGLKDGIGPRITAFFRRVAKRIEDGQDNLEQLRPVLEYVARNYPPAFLLLSELELECGNEATRLSSAAGYVRLFLESRPEPDEAAPAWERLINLYQVQGDVRGACNAVVRLAEITEPPLGLLSRIAYLLNADRSVIEGTEVWERQALLKPLAALLERHLKDATADDLSRLAWLHLHAGDKTRALEVSEIGLKRDPSHPYCARLAEKLRGSNTGRL